MKLFKFEFSHKETGEHVQTVQVRRDDQKTAELEARRIVRMFRHKPQNLNVTVSTPEL